MVEREDILSLAACPFCGRDNVTVSGPHGWYKTWCISHSCSSFYCGSSEFSGEFPSKQSAADAWNRRATPPPPAAEAPTDPDAMFAYLDKLYAERAEPGSFDRLKAMFATTPAAEAPAAADLLKLIRWAHDTLHELNPSNYDHDEVCRSNDAAVEVILGLAPVLKETHGYTPEWWAARTAEAPGQEPVAEWWLIEHDNHSPEASRQRLTDGDKRAGFRERALFFAPPTYADAEAKGFARGIEAAAKWHDEQAAEARAAAAEYTATDEGEDIRQAHLTEADGHDYDAAAIRSLASPAPKGET